METAATETMQALVLENYNTPYILKTMPRPEPGKGEVLVKVIASGVNPLDLKIKAGLAGHAKTTLPAILGVDLAGVVEKTGEGVKGFKPGDEVYGMTGGIAGIPGSLATYAVVDADLIALKPANLSMREAAALPLALTTAWEGLIDRAHFSIGNTVLIHGGAGGVGHIALQLALARGAKVFATGSPSQLEKIEAYGAIAIDYTSKSAADYVQEHTNGEGFDVVFDTLGGATLDASFSMVKHYTGHVISILGWGAHSLAPLSFRGASYSGVFTLLPLISGKGRARHGQILKSANVLIAANKLIPALDPEHYTLETIDAAYEAITNKQTKGKVVIQIA